MTNFKIDDKIIAYSEKDTEMKFIRTGKSQWYVKHNNRFYCFSRIGYMYRAFVSDLQGNIIQDTYELLDTKKLAEQYLTKLANP